MQISGKGIKLIRRWEGYALTPYQDSSGEWTVGIGHQLNVKERSMWRFPLTDAEIQNVFQGDVAKAVGRVNALLSMPVNQNQFDALVDFEYNTGALAGSTLLFKLRSGDVEGARKEFFRWIHDSRKKVVAGLMARRRDEATLFNSPVPSPAEPS